MEKEFQKKMFPEPVTIERMIQAMPSQALVECQVDIHGTQFPPATNLGGVSSGHEGGRKKFTLPFDQLGSFNKRSFLNSEEVSCSNSCKKQCDRPLAKKRNQNRDFDNFFNMKNMFQEKRDPNNFDVLNEVCDGGLDEWEASSYLSFTDLMGLGDNPNQETNNQKVDDIPHTGNEDRELRQDGHSNPLLSAEAPVTPSPVKKPISRKRRRISVDLNKKPWQRPKVKKHRPKVVVEGRPPTTPKSTGTKGKYSSREEADADPETSRKSCKRSINFDVGNNSNLNSDKTEDSFSNRNVEIEKSVTENRNQSARTFRRALRPGHCLRHTRKLGQNFPETCKKKRTLRRKKIMGNMRHTEVEGPFLVDSTGLHEVARELVDTNEKRLGCLGIEEGQLVVVDLSKTCTPTPCEGLLDPTKTKKPVPRVDLDEESVKRWDLLMMKDNNGGGEEQEEEASKSKEWEEERTVFLGRVNSFIHRMKLVQGDRSFKAWKGSVLDSVVGVFLTQNVSDLLSSSAFMLLAARFPLQTRDDEIDLNRDPIMDNVIEESKANSIEDYSYAEILNLEDTSLLEKFYSSETEKQSTDEQCSNANQTLVESGPTLDAQRISSKLNEKNDTRSRGKKAKEEIPLDWEKLRRLYSTGKESNSETMDSMDYQAVRCSDAKVVANAIEGRGQNNILAGRIQDLLQRLVKDHGSTNLEWLRDVPPEKAKDFLMSIRGIGLKSVECIRLLSLHHHAFPVDTNVGRIAVRLGWVPLQPLPGNLQIHLLNEYPMMNTIQKYLWPRLCTLDQPTLYQLHYQMITFGKVFCTKRNPNCDVCPMRGDCKHYASAFASARLHLPAPEEQNTTRSMVPVTSHGNPMVVIGPASSQYLPLDDSFWKSSMPKNFSCEPIIEEPPDSPEAERKEIEERDIEDFGIEDSDTEEIPTIDLSVKEFKENLQSYMEKNNAKLQEADMSRALVAFTSPAPIPMKLASRLRTKHQVYELPDSHCLLREMDVRETDDPCPYLLAIWTPEETKTLTKGCESEESKELCNESNSQMVHGTILIPCRAAMRGSFPLNGTYFQLNEVFADDETSRNPISIPRAWLWTLRRRILYCGTSTSSIFRGMATNEIQYCFWRGFVCWRGFNRKTRAPSRLADRFHASPASKMGKTSQEADDDQ